MAQNFTHAGDIKFAKKTMEKAEDISDMNDGHTIFNHIDRYFIKAKIQKEDGDYENAIKYADTSIKNDNSILGKVLAKMVKAQVLLRDSKIEQAKECMNLSDQEEEAVINADSTVYIKYLIVKAIISTEQHDLMNSEKILTKCQEVIKNSEANGYDISKSYEAEVVAAFGDYYTAHGNLIEANTHYIMALNLYKEFMIQLQNDTISLLLLKLSRNMKNLGSIYDFEKYKHLHLEIMGSSHFRTKEIYSLKYGTN